MTHLTHRNGANGSATRPSAAVTMPSLPCPAQTSADQWQVERFNGRISHGVKSTRFANADEMKATLPQYLELYNHHVVQRNLGYLTPVKALKAWYGKKPELFNKRVYDHMGLDR